MHRYETLCEKEISLLHPLGEVNAKVKALKGPITGQAKLLCINFGKYATVHGLLELNPSVANCFKSGRKKV